MSTIAEMLQTAVHYQQQGRGREAEEIYRRVVAQDAKCVTAWHYLGMMACQTGRYDLAVEYFRQAADAEGGSADACNNLGMALLQLDRLAEAVAAFGRALEIMPDHWNALNNLGSAFKQQGAFDQALACYVRAVAHKPDFVGAHFNLGNLYQRQGKNEEAIASYRRTIALEPRLVVAHNNLGNALQNEGRFEEAIACYRRAIELQPDYVKAYCNLGSTFQHLHRWAEARACYENAIQIDPQFAEARFARAALDLIEGDLERGFAGYEWSWKTEDLKSGALNRPHWDGSPIEPETTFLLHADQGLGDIFQFVRYAPLVKRRACTVILRCSPRMVPLLSRCAGIDTLVADDAPLPTFDVEAYLSHLPFAFKTSLATIPRDVPYLFADPHLIEHWRGVLPKAKFRIGIAWQGNPEFPDDKWRSIPLAQFAPLADVPGVQLISLQQGAGREQLARINSRFSVLDLGTKLDRSVGAFMDTAAIMMNLDLVVASDTSRAHLAGGLGVPVWVALSRMPDWRWLLERSDSPWYPTMSLFRQKTAGDWGGVFAAMKQQLEAEVAQRG